MVALRGGVVLAPDVVVVALDGVSTLGVVLSPGGVSALGVMVSLGNVSGNSCNENAPGETSWCASRCPLLSEASAATIAVGSSKLS